MHAAHRSVCALAHSGKCLGGADRYDSRMRWLLGVVLVTFLLGSAAAADRSRVVRAGFQRLNPCPVNGATRGACPGFEADHVIV